jgi:hypothetical protein
MHHLTKGEGNSHSRLRTCAGSNDSSGATSCGVIMPSPTTEGTRIAAWQEGHSDETLEPSSEHVSPSYHRISIVPFALPNSGPPISFSRRFNVGRVLVHNGPPVWRLWAMVTAYLATATTAARCHRNPQP